MDQEGKKENALPKAEEKPVKGGSPAPLASIPGDCAVAAPSSDGGAFGLPFVLNYWKEFDLESARSGMDEQGLKVAENQENSTRNRRKLAETTRDFRRGNAEDQAKAFAGLLKAYQEEVDNLTKRAKFGEAAFLGLYQKLYEAPDPVPALAAAAETAAKLAEVVGESRRMRAELEEFRAESAHLKNQQATVRRLEERNRQLEQMMEEKVKEMVAMRQQVLAEESQRSVEAIKEREAALQEQLRVAKESVENMQRLHEMGQSQLFEVRAKSEEEREAKQYEVTLLTDEVDRAQARLLSLEREKEALKAQLKEVAGSSSSNSITTSGGAAADAEGSQVLQHSWEAALRAKEAIISELHTELHSVESSAASQREAQLQELKRLHADLRSKEVLVEQLRADLSVRPSAKQWEDLRRQVKILQAVGYNAVEVDDWEEQPGCGNGAGGVANGADGEAHSGPAGSGVSGGDIGRLEALLLEKNRRVEHELTQAKVLLAEKEAAAASLQEGVSALEARVEEQKQLIAKLEEDILRGYSHAGIPRAAGMDSRAGGGTQGALAGLVGGAAAPAGAAGRDFGPGDSAAGEPGTRWSGGVEGDGGRAAEGSAGGGAGDAGAVLAVVCAQRDRFRQRIANLEEEVRVLKDKCARLSTEVERLQGDNVKLYERMRYVQQYSVSSSSSVAAASERGPTRTGRKAAGDVEAWDVEQKYRKMYEDGLNPFAAFSSKERELRYKELGLRDWIALTSGRFLLSNKHARTFVFFYSIALHALVFLSMYRLSTYSHRSVSVPRRIEVGLSGGSLQKNVSLLTDDRLPSL